VRFSSRQYAEVTVAVPEGRIDHASAAAFEEALAPLLARAVDGKGAVVLDFAGVEYISSVGLRALMIAAKQMRAGNARIVVAALQPVVAEIVTISRFDRVLDVFPDVRGALRQVSPPALAAFDAA
jgi:anti-sigma B factor antagonist